MHILSSKALFTCAPRLNNRHHFLFSLPTYVTENLHLKANITGEEELTSFPSLLWLCGKLSCFLFLNPPEPYVEMEKKVG